MRKTVAIVAIIAMALFSVACEPTIDGSSEEAFDDSIEQIAEEEDEIEEMGLRIAAEIVGAHLAIEEMGEEEFEELDEEERGEAIREAVDGKTAQQINDIGEEELGDTF